VAREAGRQPVAQLVAPHAEPNYSSGFPGEMRPPILVPRNQRELDGRTTPRRYPTMSEPRNGGVKTLGIKLPDVLHAQFALVAQLDGISLGDAALRAVELYVTTKRQETDFATRATAALEEIEREASARRGAIEGLFGNSAEEAAPTGKPTPSRTRKTGGEEQS
jgi:hypothetical protein